MMILNKQVSIILMKKDNNGKYLSALNKKAKIILSKGFGGVTITRGSGTWVDNNNLYEDKNYIYHMNYAGKFTNAQKSALIDVINMEFLEGKQLAVSVMFGTSLVILERSDLDKLDTVLVRK